MKRGLSLSLVVVLAALEPVALAQERQDRPEAHGDQTPALVVGPLTYAALFDAPAQTQPIMPASPDAGAAKDPLGASSDWSRVGALAPRTEVSVTLGDGSIARGLFLSTDDVTLTLVSDARRIERFARADIDVVAVRQRGVSIFGRFGPVGSSVFGSYAGAHLSAIVSCRGLIRCSDDNALGVTLASAVTGGLAGGLVARHLANRVRERVIYRAPQTVI